jgi:hypothetical protein
VAFAEILAIASGSCDRISCLADFTCIDRSVLMLDFCNQWPSWKGVSKQNKRYCYVVGAWFGLLPVGTFTLRKINGIVSAATRFKDFA